MKRNIYKYLLLTLSFTFVLVSCDDSDNLAISPLQSQKRVYLDAGNPSSVAETAVIQQTADGELSSTSNAVSVSVLRTGNDFTQEITVSYSATAVYNETNDFVNEGDDASGDIEFSSDTFVIPAGESAGSINVYVADDVLSNGNRTITITLTGVSDSSYELGFTDSDPKTSIAISYTDDDCPVDINNFVGDYTLVSMVRPSDGLDLCNFGTCAEDGAMTIDTSDPSNTTLLLDAPSAFGDPLVLKLITCPQQVELKNVTTVLGSFGSFSWEQNVEADGPFLGIYEQDGSKLTFWGGLDTPGNGYEVTLQKIEE